MCRNKDHGGRRCPRTTRSRQLNTLNRRIQRLRIKRDSATLQEERQQYEDRISEIEREKRSEPLQGLSNALAALLDKRMPTVPQKPSQPSMERSPEPEAPDVLPRVVQPLSPNTRVVSVFRSGDITPPAERVHEGDSYRDADALKPEGRVGRTEAVFASPSLFGVCRWVRGNRLANQGDQVVRELRVDPDSTYVYNVKAWETASWSLTGTPEERYQAFWDTGMTLREWYDRGIDDGDQWELLLSVDDIRSAKNVGVERVAEQADELDRNDIRSILKTAMKNARRART